MADKIDEELLKVIGDFLEMGHVENIMAMFKQDTTLYAMTGKLLRDERFIVRMGVAVLFEEMKVVRPREIILAIPALVPLLTDEIPWIRGEATNILGIIGSQEALDHLKTMSDDPDPQVREIANDYLDAS